MNVPMGGGVWGGDEYWTQQTLFSTTMCCVWHCAIAVSSKDSSQDGHCQFTITDQFLINFSTLLVGGVECPLLSVIVLLCRLTDWSL